MSRPHRPEVRNSYLAEVGVRVGKRVSGRVGTRVGDSEGSGSVGMTVGVRELNSNALVGAKVGNGVSSAGDAVGVDVGNVVVGRHVGIPDPLQRLQVFLHFSCTTAGGSHPPNTSAQS